MNRFLEVLAVLPEAVCCWLANMALKLWCGEYSISKAFWVFLVLGKLIATVIFYWISRALYGDIPLYVIWTPYMCYIFLAYVGVWKSATKYSRKYKKSGRYSATLAMFFVKFIVLGMALNEATKFIKTYQHSIVS